MDVSKVSSSQAGAVPPTATPRAARPDGARTPAAGGGRDRIELSPQAQELARAEQAVQDSGELRFDVVSKLRSEVRDGTYRVDARAVARAMVERGERAE